MTHKQDNNQPEETQEIKELRMQALEQEDKYNFTTEELDMYQEYFDQKEFEAVREYEKQNDRNFTR